MRWEVGVQGGCVGAAGEGAAGDVGRQAGEGDRVVRALAGRVVVRARASGRRAA